MNEIYKTMNQLAIKAKVMNNISKDEKLKFDKARNIKKEQDKIYKKFAFYQGFIKAMNKKEGI
jgi:hypothetical protein